MRQSILTLLVISFGAIAWPAVGQGRAADLPDRAKECWAEYEQRVRQVSGAYETRTLRNGKEEDHNKSEVIGTLQYRLYTRRMLKFSGKDRLDEFVSCVNPAYTFAIKRKTAESPWQILTLAAAKNEEEYRDALSRTDSAVQILLAPVMVNRTPLARLFAEPGLQILDLSEGTKDGQPTWQVKFACPHAYRPKDTDYIPVQAGELTFTREHWLLLGYTAELLHPGPIRATANFTYSGLPGPTPLPLTATERVEIAAFGRDPAAPITVESTTTYQLAPTVGRPDPDRFRLTAFGLTEPAGVADLFPPPWYTRWYVWTLAVAAGLLGLGWYLNRGRRPAARG
jgi:hypothetical protein